MSHFKIPSLAKNIISTLLRQISSIIIGLGLSIFLARTLGPEGNGLYALAILLPTLLTNFLNLGIAPANVYFISRNDVSVQDAFNVNLWIAYALSFIGLCIGALIITQFPHILFPNVPTKLLWFSLIGFPICLIQSYGLSVLQGIQDFKKFNVFLITLPIVNIVFSWIAIWLFKLDVLGGVVGYISANLFGIFLILIFLKNKLSQDNHLIFPKVSVKYFKQSISYGWKASFSNILTFINYKLDIFLVNFFLDPAATGVYIIAIQLAERLWIFSSAANTVILPKLSNIYSGSDDKYFLTPLVSRLIFLITCFCSILLAILAPLLVEFFFGSAYLASVNALLLLLPGMVLFSVAKIIANDIAARGRPEINMYNAFVVILVNLFTNIFLIPRFGISGAAIATSLSYLSNTIAVFSWYCMLTQKQWWKLFLITQDDINLLKKILTSNNN